MSKKIEIGRNLFTVFIGGVFMLLLVLPVSLWAADPEVDALKEQLRQLTETMQNIEKKIADIEEKNTEKTAEMKELDTRLNKAELHTATDKLSLGIELRSRGDNMHYQDMMTAPDALLAGFFTPVAMGGFNGATPTQIQQGMAQMAQYNMVPAPEKNNLDNDIMFTNRFRINMKAKINPQLDFGGRLAAYKVWGDSSGVKFNNGSISDMSLDGTTTSIPNGDGIHLERAYFNYKAGSDVPINFSLGRRPSTEGPPLEYSMNSLEGGSPLAHIINWQFDGASLNFGLENATGIPGAAFKLCYGVGFESGWGSSGSLKHNSQLDDVHMFGFIADLYNDDITSVVFNYAHAFDITDGFTGQTVMPFIVSAAPDGTLAFEPNSGAFISRTEPTTNIGDWDAATVLFRHNFLEQFDKDINFFLSLAWSHTEADSISNHPFYSILGQGLLSSNGELENHHGYSIYTGAIFPMPFEAKLGLEYNWGSKYWFNFTGAEDSIVGSKLAARGHVWEAYYIQPIMRDNFFVTLGGKYYDYAYTGSGNPLGEPVKISEATAFDTLFPVVDKLWNVYVSATVRF